MAEHIHGCPNCHRDMVPDFDPKDSRYHSVYCGVRFTVTLDGDDVRYTMGVFEGAEGWVLFAGRNQEDIHVCPCKLTDPNLCVEPRFGRVEVTHGCPRTATPGQLARLAAELS